MVNRHYTIRHGAVDKMADIETAFFKVLSNARNKVKFFTSACAGLWQCLTVRICRFFKSTRPVSKAPR